MGRSVLVVAVGDPDAGRDAVGPLILAQMLKDGLPPNATACSVGRRPDRLPDVVASSVADTGPATRLILLDAVTSSTKPEGTLVEREITLVGGAPPALSSHGAGLQEALGLLHLQLGRNAPVRIVLLGIVVGPAANGPMPDDVARAIPRAAERARDLLEGVWPPRRAGAPG